MKVCVDVDKSYEGGRPSVSLSSTHPPPTSAALLAPTMTSYFQPGVSNGANSPASPLSPPAQRSTALTNRLTTVLSASYADSDIRDSLETLNIRGVHNSAETRRQLRLDVQKEVVDCNAEIVRDFGKVAEVCLLLRSASQD